MKDLHTIRIVHAEETLAESLARDAGTMCLFMALIGVGVVLDSSAMQWAGFIVAFIILLAWAGKSSVSGTTKKMTVEEAKKYLEELEGK